MKPETEKTINAIIDNLAEKLDAPAAAISEAATYGFEKYVDFIWADALLSVVYGSVLIMMCLSMVLVAMWAFRNEKKEEYSHGGWGAISICSGLISIVLLMIGAWIVCSSLTVMIEPEGRAIREISGLVRYLK